MEKITVQASGGSGWVKWLALSLAVPFRKSQQSASFLVTSYPRFTETRLRLQNSKQMSELYQSVQAALRNRDEVDNFRTSVSQKSSFDFNSKFAKKFPAPGKRRLVGNKQACHALGEARLFFLAISIQQSCVANFRTMTQI
ncbi:hypothetical protein RvY_15847 [Ramazzottius varieornatus]|uniref:Uncharacterized protein n=1 Tax=Ramazzottius varieornatus TaxID=947166 RepID=A0A1D1VWC8_RAMVA|nr:hypothetical protein RvY_15847 [Ramazzottius varieornatus]